MKQPIELRRLRDFGQIINDSFTFLKENFKPMFLALLVICGFIIVLNIISSVFTYMNMGTMFNTTVSSNSYEFQSTSVSYIVSAVINAFVMVLMQLFVHLTTICYISVYIQKNNHTPTLAEVWGYFRYYFFRVLGGGILICILAGLGLVFCIIPGVYIGTVFHLIIPIIVIENTTFGFAFNKGFRLVKGNWWFLFGLVIVMSLIVGIAGSIVNIPIGVMPVLSMYFKPLKAIYLPMMILLSSLRSIFFLAYALPAIAVCMAYFNFAEEKEAPGLLDRIEKLGQKDDESSTLPTEEY